MDTAPRLANLLAGAVRDPATPLLVNLSSVTFIDSSGLEVLIQGTRLAKNAGVELILERPSTACRLVTKMAGLDGVLRIRG